MTPTATSTTRSLPVVRQRGERLAGRAGPARHRRTAIRSRSWSRRAAPTSRRSPFPSTSRSDSRSPQLGRSSVRYRIGVFASKAEQRGCRKASSSTCWSTEHSRRPVEMPAKLATSARSDQLAQSRAFAAAYCSASMVDDTRPPAARGRRRRCPGPSPRCRATPWTCSILPTPNFIASAALRRDCPGRARR